MSRLLLPVWRSSAFPLGFCLVALWCLSATSVSAQPTDRAFLGVSTVVTERGAEITMVTPNSPAAQAGLQSGDVIRSIEGFLLGRKGPVVFSLTSELRHVAGLVQLDVIQGATGKMTTFAVDVGGPAQPPAPPANQRRGRLGVMSVNQPDGEHVTEVYRDTPAATAGIQVGDRITAVNGFSVGQKDGNIYSLPSEIRRAAGNVQIALVRQGQPLSLNVNIEQGPSTLPTKLHIVLAGLTDDDAIGKGCTSNLEMMEGLVREAFEDTGLLDLKVLRGQRCNADSVLAAVDQMQVTPTEVVMVYYSGHGAYDTGIAAGDPSGGHYFQIPGKHLARRTLRDHMVEKGARLTVLISDTCNVRCDLEIPAEVRGLPPRPDKKVLYHLLVGSTGIFDLSGSSRNEYGWFLPIGGLFTISLAGNLDTYEPMTWEALLERTKFATDHNYAKLREAGLAENSAADPDIKESLKNQLHQTPLPFLLNLQPVR